MPAEIVHTRLVTAAAHEVLTIMDDYGTEHILHIPIKDGANRQARIDKTVALMSANKRRLRNTRRTTGMTSPRKKRRDSPRSKPSKGANNEKRARESWPGGTTDAPTSLLARLRGTVCEH